jgi:hypothetical protein
MDAFVVDTNVPIVANGNAPQAGPACVNACVSALGEIVHDGTIVLDDGGRILDEYFGHLSPSGQPGVGDSFMKWVWEHQAVAERCEQAAIHPLDEDETAFEEFPDDPELDTFDPSDRKFVATALASKSQPEVLNAVDSDWWEYRVPLERNGVRLRFLCPEQFQ